MSVYKFTILGCGSSGGVPRLGNHWGNCDPAEKKNHRTRCSLLVQKFSGSGVTTVLVDTSPDMRAQLINASISTLDGVIYTHYHADHIHGIDDLRMIVINRKKRLPVWADQNTRARLLKCFDYIFEPFEGSKYPPILNINNIEEKTAISGSGGEIIFESLKVNHGEIDALGFRIGNMAYIPDVLYIYDSTWALLKNLKYLVIDALRYAPHPSHTHLEQTLDWIKIIKPDKAILTNMHNDLDYKTLNSQTPRNIFPAYDGLNFEISY